MRAVVLTEHGDPEVLTVAEVPTPEPGPEEVLVAIRATALNRADLLQRKGFYPEPGPPREHEIPGMELAGTVAAVGPRTSQWEVGDEVMGIVSGGAYAERIAVHERQLLPVPPEVGLADAAAIPEVWITAWDALVLQGGLASGGTALVHAGASGRRLGRHPADQGPGRPGHHHRLGHQGRGLPRLRGRCGGRLRPAGLRRGGVGGHRGAWASTSSSTWSAGDYLARNLKALRTGGTIVQVGVMGGGRTEVDLGAMLPKRARLVGTVLRAGPLEEKIAVTQRFGRQVLPLFASGALHPVIDSRYDLDHIADAHRHMEANANVGKILVDVAV